MFVLNTKINGCFYYNILRLFTSMEVECNLKFAIVAYKCGAVWDFLGSHDWVLIR